MIAVRLSGGLGNQLFQFAAGYSLAKMNSTAVAVETSFYANNNSRIMMLGDFIADPRVSDFKEIYDEFNIPGSYYIDRLLKRNKVLAAPYLFREKYFHFDNDFYKCHDHTYLDGYWQSEKYFTGHNADIKRLFTPKQSAQYNKHPVFSQLNNRNAVAVHIRGGDYLSDPAFNKIHGSCSDLYYSAARELILQKNPAAVFYIFSDQPELIAEKWKHPDYKIISDKSNDPLLEFYLMQQPPNIIIANSTFSWWAAWLNSSEEKQVIAPRNWFRDQSKITSDLFPSDWVLING